MRSSCAPRGKYKTLPLSPREKLFSGELRAVGLAEDDPSLVPFSPLEVELCSPPSLEGTFGWSASGDVGGNDDCCVWMEQRVCVVISGNEVYRFGGWW
mmetsp:Transcript_69616/g.81254  ORF Transcript_69616/g.81254 Transcript_69616/m.81254 type:complete len:98 (+) Transcript_69616:104-397(+)